MEEASSSLRDLEDGRKDLGTMDELGNYSKRPRDDGFALEMEEFTGEFPYALMHPSPIFLPRSSLISRCTTFNPSL
ncbi:MAG: hypothetical protein FJ117_22780 [Deltaproteobacteria bacterium]|nr:hypothetical protein [Deltaproteobacteria bacterium]